MPTSGTIVTTTTAKDIIQETLELLGALGEGELANAAQEASLLRTLRNMCATWQADGLNLFAVTSLAIFLTPGQVVYRIGEGSAILAERFNRHKTTVATTSGNAVLTVEDDAEFDPDYGVCGVELENGEMHWAYVTAYGSNTISLQVPVPDDVAVGAIVFTLKQAVDHRFMKALHGSYLGADGVSIPMEAMSRNDYDALTNKDTTGIPLQYYVDTQALYNDVFIWPTANSRSQVVRLDVQRQLDSVVSTANDLAFPAEWFLPLSVNLAYISSAKYGLPMDDTNRLRNLAATYYDMASDFDFEWGTSIYFQPNDR